MLETRYQALCDRMETAVTEQQFKVLADGFGDLGDYKDSPRFAAECLGKVKSTAKKAHRRTTIKRLLTGIVILGIVFAVIGVPLLKKTSYRVDLFSVEVTDKVNVDYDDDTVSFVFKFNIINESRHNANYLEGYITISDTEGTVLANGSTWFSGVIAAHNKNYHELSLDLERDGAGGLIWNSDFTELIITYRITEIRFEDGIVPAYFRLEDVYTMRFQDEYNKLSRLWKALLYPLYQAGAKKFHEEYTTKNAEYAPLVNAYFEQVKAFEEEIKQIANFD